MTDITQGALHLAIQITGCRDEALDILQTALVKGMEHGRAPLPRDRSYRAWLYRVVHNQSVDWLRSRRKFSDSQTVIEPVSDEDPSGEIDQDRRRLLLHRALRNLPPEQREIICLRDFHDMSYVDIAEVMGLEKGTVMSRLHRARQALKQELIGLGIFSGEEDEM